MSFLQTMESHHKYPLILKSISAHCLGVIGVQDKYFDNHYTDKCRVSGRTELIFAVGIFMSVYTKRAVTVPFLFTFFFLIWLFLLLLFFTFSVVLSFFFIFYSFFTRSHIRSFVSSFLPSSFIHSLTHAVAHPISSLPSSSYKMFQSPSFSYRF